MKLNSICVYCGSSPGRSTVYRKAAQALGAEIARRKIHLIYGGSCVGLMGETARAALEGGAKVTGVIPQAIAEQELAYQGLDELIVVNSMHERKAKMAELADGFIALPGGFGTFDEFFEVLTWAQLGMHTKPCGLLNVDNYYGILLGFLDHAVKEMFIHQPHREMILSAVDPGNLIEQMDAYDEAPMSKADWVHALEGNQDS